MMIHTDTKKLQQHSILTAFVSGERFRLYFGGEQGAIHAMPVRCTDQSKFTAKQNAIIVALTGDWHVPHTDMSPDATMLLPAHK